MGAAVRAPTLAPPAAAVAPAAPGGFAALPRRAPADEERRRRQVRSPAPGLRAPRRTHDPGRSRVARALPRAARAALRRRAPGHGVAVHDHHVGLRAAGRSAGARRVARTGRASARHHAVGDQDPLDGRQLRAADAVLHAGRGRLSGVPPRSADPAPPGAVRERHPDHRRPVGVDALLRDRAAGSPAPSPGRVLRRDAAVAGDGGRAARRGDAVQREAGDGAAAQPDAAVGGDGRLRGVRQRHPVHARGQGRARSRADRRRGRPGAGRGVRRLPAAERCRTRVQGARPRNRAGAGRRFAISGKSRARKSPAPPFRPHSSGGRRRVRAMFDGGDR